MPPKRRTREHFQGLFGYTDEEKAIITEQIERSKNLISVPYARGSRGDVLMSMMDRALKPYNTDNPHRSTPEFHIAELLCYIKCDVRRLTLTDANRAEMLEFLNAIARDLTPTYTGSHCLSELYIHSKQTVSIDTYAENIRKKIINELYHQGVDIASRMIQFKY